MEKNNEKSMKIILGLRQNMAVIFTLVNQLVGRVVTIQLLVAMCLACPALALAQTIKLIDQFGQPVTNAVVAIAQEQKPHIVPTDIAVMDQMNKQFVPQVLVIQQGQQVSFPNSDDIRHHVYSFSAPKPFEIKLFKGAVTEPVTFEQPGIVVLGCNIHDKMLGYIYVAQNETSYLSNEQGMVELPENTTEITLWQANLSAQNSQRKTINLTTLKPLPNSDVLTISLTLLHAPMPSETESKSTSKFKKKFN